MSLQKQLERELGISIPIRAGAPGSLRVLVDGNEVYSRKDAGGAAANAAVIAASIRKKEPAR